MKRFMLILALLLATTHPLPAPIHEIPETPTPTPAPATKARPTPSAVRRKPAPKPLPRVAAPAKPSRFAGAWAGTMATFPFGNLHTVLTVDPTETAMAVSWYDAADSGDAKTHAHFKPAAGNAAIKPAFAKATRNGDTLTAAFPAPLLGSSTWSLTPQPDGKTALVRMQAFSNDFSATFDRTYTAEPVAP